MYYKLFVPNYYPEEANIDVKRSRSTEYNVIDHLKQGE